MNLNTFCSDAKCRLFEELSAGKSPSFGSFDAKLFADARVKGAPQMGVTRYLPYAVAFEFIYPDSRTSASVLTVTVETPEPILFLPVPSWVIESIWQGEISGSYHFQTQALELVRQFQDCLDPEQNAALFSSSSAMVKG